MHEPKPKPSSRPREWVATTYFAEGFPYTVVHTLAEVLFKEFGADLKAIGLTSLLHLPWNLKFLWGPFLDGFATKRAWLVWTEVGIASILVALASVSTLDNVLTVASVLFTVLAFLSATHDIAIDGFYLEALDKEGQAKYVGFRVTAYRLAMLSVSGPAVIAIGHSGWALGFLATATVMGLLLFYHFTFLPRVEIARKPIGALFKVVFRFQTLLFGLGLAGGVLLVRQLIHSPPVQETWENALTRWTFLSRISTSEWIAIGFLLVLLALLLSLGRIRAWIATKDSFYAAAFVDFLSQKQIGRILAFIILFRTGESFLLKMRYAFLRDIGMTMEQFGVAAGTVGVIASLTATMLGGYLIGKYGLKRWIWPFVLLQNVLQLLYMGISYYYVDLGYAATAPVNVYLLTVVITIEAFGAGLGTAVFMVYMMRCCRPAYKAAHMAILTALMSLSFTLAGVASGFLAEWMGFTLFFGFTFAAAIPGMVLIFFVPYLDGTTAADEA